MNKIRFTITLILLPILLLSMAASGKPPETGGSEGAENYALSPNDLVSITVFQESDLASNLRISKDGTITFPLIGIVKIGGKSPQAAATTIRDMLGKRFLRHPQVNLTVIEYAKRRFTVLGQVQRPGAYAMPDRDSLMLLQAIGMAGGYTRIADPAKITLKRITNGIESVLKLNAKNMASKDGSSAFEVQEGDVITVGESIF